MPKPLDFAHSARLGRKLFRMSLPLRQLNADARQSVDVVIVGAQKAGTTYLFSLLTKSDGFYGPPVKEIHYFDVAFGKGPKWYAAHFERKGTGNLQVDASPYYMFHPHVPARIAQTCKDVKIVAVLRDPVERAYSHYHHNIRNGRETLSFQDALSAEAERITPQMEALQHDPDAPSDQYRHFSYVERGKYSDQVARLYDAFPRAQIHLVDSARMFTHDRDEMAGLALFLGKDIPTKDGLDVRQNAGQYADLGAAAVTQLKDVFAPYDAALCKISQRSWSWMSAP